MGVEFELIGAEYISIGELSFWGKRNTLAAYGAYRNKSTGYTPQLKIGDNVTAMDNCQISCANRIEIGNGTLLGDNVFITDNYHGYITKEELNIPPIERELGIKGPVIIGENVWVGRNVCIMPGVTIGDGAVIGANSVVTKDVPAECVAAGIPVRIVREMK